ncbi:MAG: amidohydrolase family protein [Gemmatimonadetes bacterium]|nr:amidohydrolase family protein [Gemmatimonadota bacterium]
MRNAFAWPLGAVPTVGFLTIALVFPRAASHPPPNDPVTTAITHVNIVPMDRDTVLQDMTLIVRGGRIAALGRADDVAIPDGARMIDGAGRYLTPGLVDAHVHLDSTAMSMYLVHGITTVRNMVGAPSDLRLREHVNRGALVGPTVRTATPYFTTQPSELMWYADTPERARAGVRRFAHEGYDWIKVVRLDDDVLQAVVDEARKFGLSVGGHVDTEQSFGRFVESGIDSWEHLKSSPPRRFRDAGRAMRSSQRWPIGSGPPASP